MGTRRGMPWHSNNPGQHSPASRHVGYKTKQWVKSVIVWCYGCHWRSDTMTFEHVSVSSLSFLTSTRCLSFALLRRRGWRSRVRFAPIISSCATRTCVVLVVGVVRCGPCCAHEQTRRHCGIIWNTLTVSPQTMVRCWDCTRCMLEAPSYVLYVCMYVCMYVLFFCSTLMEQSVWSVWSKV